MSPKWLRMEEYLHIYYTLPSLNFQKSCAAWNVSVSFVTQLRHLIGTSSWNCCKSYLNFEAKCVKLHPFCLFVCIIVEGLFSYKTEKGEDTHLAEKCRGNYERDFLNSQSASMCALCPPLPSTSAAKTCWRVSFWLALKCSVLPSVKQMCLCFNWQLLCCKMPSRSPCCWEGVAPARRSTS